MLGSGASPGTLSFRLAGDVEKSCETFSATGKGLRDRRRKGDDGDSMTDLGRSRPVMYELCLIPDEFLAA